MEPESNLAFDVNPGEGFGFCSIEVPVGFAHQEVDNGITLFKKLLSFVIDKELISIAVGIKPELLSYESKLHV